MQQKELADALGISPTMVSKLVKRGMPATSLEAAQRWRRRHLEPARMKNARMNAGLSAFAAGLLPSPTDEEDPDAEPNAAEADSAEYRAARAQRERTMADRAQLELQRLRGTLVDVAEVSRVGFTFFRMLRDNMEAVPLRIGAQLAAMTDQQQVETLLGDELRALLKAAADQLEAGALVRDQDERDFDEG